jgi:hypothetical protein
VYNKLFKLLSTTFYHVIIVILISVFGATKEPNLLNYTLLVGIRCAQIIVKKKCAQIKEVRVVNYTNRVSQQQLSQTDQRI